MLGLRTGVFWIALLAIWKLGAPMGEGIPALSLRSCQEVCK